MREEVLYHHHHLLPILQQPLLQLPQLQNHYPTIEVYRHHLHGSMNQHKEDDHTRIAQDILLDLAILPRNQVLLPLLLLLPLFVIRDITIIVVGHLKKTDDRHHEVVADMASHQGVVRIIMGTEEAVSNLDMHTVVGRVGEILIINNTTMRNMIGVILITHNVYTKSV